MRKLTLVASLALALVVPASSMAKPPTRVHEKQYAHAYAAARRHFGSEAVGCYLLRRRGYGSCHVKTTDARVRASLAVIVRLYAPPPAVSYTSPSVSYTSPGTATSYTAAPYQATQVTSYAGGTYISCIIGAESGGSPTAQNGQYTGIGQWSPTQWQIDQRRAGVNFSSTAAGASYQQQYQVLQSEGTSGMYQQQGRYDRCGHP